MASTLELAISSTTLFHDASTSKSYTLYNITLRLPLRTYVVQKRYSEFVSLHSALTAVTSCPPPVPLPGKTWFSSTKNSAKLTEDRRKGLEKYLRAILEGPDRQWQETSVWRNFLNLPSKGGGSDSKKNLVATMQRGLQAGQLTADPTVWLDVHREMKTQLHDARLFLGQRDGATTAQAQHVAGANAKKCLVKAGTLISDLEEGLKIMNELGKKNGEYTMGTGELRRRKDLLGSASVEREALEKLALSLAIKSQSLSAASGETDNITPEKKTLLLSSIPRKSGRVLGAPIAETDYTRELGNEGIVQLQKQMMENQDQDVEELAKIVRRQKEMGLAIYNELELQNEMLKKVDDGVDRVGMKINVAKKRASKIR
ncbi:Vacuolar morphogenesis protein 7-like protein [Golovinomyces cichoracearum]|uniref:Vacuolar morphogenesis protein 7-like protein n=1 Tax=Golovinomyces cichoracearum TaxID=62708 RepID=A0A420IV30_9PEZI|nr:Vacuolar morphogenesis protein 7-like protein [Golovinomyces cichoracearum]